jgi:S-adenosylmethionine:tRNA ribosyltransferase-isomerase
VPDNIQDFDFQLPPELIADAPLAMRSASRMLVVNRISHSFDDRKFTDVVGYLRPTDVLVVNNTKVFPARLYGTTETGARVEIFLVKQIDGDRWEVLAKPGRRLVVGKRIGFDPRLFCTVIEKHDNGNVIVEFHAKGDLDVIIDDIGRTPLPPYIKREYGAVDTDRERYQTVFASERGAIAAPTAGLHFTPELLATIAERGTEIVEITLHVGYGTFEPVRVSDLSEHSVSPERYHISENAADVLNNALSQKRRIVCVGTTTTRALESCFTEHSAIVSGDGTANLTIKPGYNFSVAGALLTNFHLPQSSLLVLVSTFAGRELIMETYEHAIGERYRFYSYGDCMLIQ